MDRQMERELDKLYIEGIQKDKKPIYSKTIVHDFGFELEMLVRDYEIYLDTCFIMDKFFENFLLAAAASLRNHGKKLVVCSAVIRELDEISANPEKNWQAAQRGRVYLDALFQRQLAKIDARFDEYGKKVHADARIRQIFVSDRISKRLLLITADKDCAADMLKENDSLSVNGNDVLVRCPTENEGNLVHPIERYGEFRSSTEQGKDYAYMDGIYCGNIYGDVDGDIRGEVIGSIKGNVNGSIFGIVRGNVYGDVNGDVNGVVDGRVIGKVRGKVRGSVNGNLYGSARRSTMMGTNRRVWEYSFI